MHYRQAGAGPHVLLLHGVFANKEQWDSVLCLLAAGGYTAIAPDLPGYGQSVDFPVTDYKLENQVARVREFLERLGVTRFDIAGNSMGGAIAALYARQYPEQAYTLAFIGGPLGITDWSEPFKEAVYQGVNPLIPVTVAEFDLELSLLLVNPPTLPEETKQAAIKDYVERNRHYQQIWTIVSLYDRVLEPPRFWIRTPALILWGEQDRIFPVDGAATLRQRFPHGKLVKLPNAGHLLHLENPAEIATIYLDFLRTYSRIHARGR
jgi:pimeloyl-ACP methyl ester carboxylesterase